MIIALYWSLTLILHEFIRTQADQLCSYYNQSIAFSTTCPDKCCSGTPSSSASAACCSSMTWSTLAVPVSIVVGFFLFAILLIYSRVLFKLCFCEYSCPCGNRSRVMSANDSTANDNPMVSMNNRDLPDYETVIKNTRTKDPTPPPYNFVTAHPTDFGIDTRVPSAPPQYRSRNNSIVPNGLTPVIL